MRCCSCVEISLQRLLDCARSLPTRPLQMVAYQTALNASLGLPDESGVSIALIAHVDGEPQDVELDEDDTAITVGPAAVEFKLILLEALSTKKSVTLMGPLTVKVKQRIVLVTMRECPPSSSPAAAVLRVAISTRLPDAPGAVCAAGDRYGSKRSAADRSMLPVGFPFPLPTWQKAYSQWSLEECEAIYAWLVERKLFVPPPQLQDPPADSSSVGEGDFAAAAGSIAVSTGIDAAGSSGAVAAGGVSGFHDAVSALAFDALSAASSVGLMGSGPSASFPAFGVGSDDGSVPGLGVASGVSGQYNQASALALDSLPVVSAEGMPADAAGFDTSDGAASGVVAGWSAASSSSGAGAASVGRLVPAAAADFAAHDDAGAGSSAGSASSAAASAGAAAASTGPGPSTTGKRPKGRNAQKGGKPAKRPRTNAFEGGGAHDDVAGARVGSS